MRGSVLATIGAVGGAVVLTEAAAVARVARHGDRGDRPDHGATVGDGTGEALELVLLGDSAVDGYGLATAESLPHQLARRLASATRGRVRVRSLAASGARTADVVTDQLPQLRDAGRVDAVLVGVGVNDVLKRTGTGALAEATEGLVGGLRAIVPGASVAVVVCHDLSGAPGLGPVLRRVVGARCRAVAGHQRRVLADAGAAVVDLEGPGEARMYGSDGLHPGPAAIEAIADRCAPALLASARATARRSPTSDPAASVAQ